MHIKLIETIRPNVDNLTCFTDLEQNFLETLLHHEFGERQAFI